MIHIAIQVDGLFKSYLSYLSHLGHIDDHICSTLDGSYGVRNQDLRILRRGHPPLDHRYQECSTQFIWILWIEYSYMVAILSYSGYFGYLAIVG